MASCSKPSEWREIIRNEALRIGFDACGFARVEEVDVDMRDSYRQWLASGKQAQMGYLDNYVELRDNPALLYPGARTMICVALNYYPVRFQSGESPRFAYYAYGRDYHDVMRDKLRQLAVFCFVLFWGCGESLLRYGSGAGTLLGGSCRSRLYREKCPVDYSRQRLFLLLGRIDNFFGPSSR